METRYYVSARPGHGHRWRRLGRHKRTGKMYWFDSPRGKTLRRLKRLDGSVTAAQLREEIRPWAKAKGLVLQSKPVNPYPGLSGDTAGLGRGLLQALQAVASESGKTLHIASGLRTYAEQKVLYERYLSGNGPLAAKPGTSRHETGLAADVHVDGRNIGNVSGMRDLLDKHGLHLPARGEAWHVELNP